MQSLKKGMTSRNAAVGAVAAVPLKQSLKAQQRLQSLISKLNYSKMTLMQAQQRPQTTLKNPSVGEDAVVRAKLTLKRKRQIQHLRRRLERNKSGSVELT